MLLHFLNNVWAVIASQSIDRRPNGDHGGRSPSWKVSELVTGAIATVMLGIALWQSRVKFIQSDGQEWISPRFPVRVPPYAGIQRRAASPINSMLWGTAIACAILCNLIVAFAVLAPAFEAV